MFKVKIIGTGASIGVPMLGCDCTVCTSNNPKNKRLRCSLFVTTPAGYNIIIDTSPDLREQCLRYNVKKLDAIYITHCHFDHVEGLNEVRPFNFKSKEAIKLFTHEDHWPPLETRFDYIFKPNPDYPGAPPAMFDLTTFKTRDRFKIFDLEIQTLWAQHGDTRVAGLIFNNLAYIPDCNAFDDQDRAYLKNIKHLIIDGMWPEIKSKNHFNIEEATAFGKSIDAEKIYLTHLSHHVNYEERSRYEDDQTILCYDGLEISL